MVNSSSPSGDRRPEALSPQLRRLHEISVCGRWLFVGLCWLLLAPWSLWSLREGLELAWERFTWATIHYHLGAHPWATLGLAFCVGSTAAVLVWQSRNILFGLSRHDLRRLERQLERIHRLGRRHPLWRWLETGDRGAS